MTERLLADPHSAPEQAAEFRFYAELNDFLPAERRQRTFEHRYTGRPSLKDTIEALGVPHTEIDLILLDGRAAAYSERLLPGSRVAVFPMFERIDVASVTRVRREPLRRTRFIADVHLGTLARYLRLIGFDTLWRNDLCDEEIVEISVAARRIVLTRDRGLLRNRRLTHGYLLRETDPLHQLEEIVRALDLGLRIDPYTRCLQCNGRLDALQRADAARLVPPRVRDSHQEFVRCRGCGRVYWPGSHRGRLDAIIEAAKAAAGL